MATSRCASHDLSKLRVLGATASHGTPRPGTGASRSSAAGRCPIINYSGGTEISGGIVGCTTITPIKPCSFAGPVPGIAADVVDEQGNPVRGQVGELVIRQPWPGMTRGFWHDPARYEDAYWSRIPGIWVHGDWAAVDSDGFWYILGRSDDTIKVAGKRLGPAEVESAAVAHPAVTEAAAIGVPHEIKGEAIVVFVVLQPGVEQTEQLREEITRGGHQGAWPGDEAGGGALRHATAQDAQRQGAAPADPRAPSRQDGPRRHLLAGEPGGAGGHSAGALETACETPCLIGQCERPAMAAIL